MKHDLPDYGPALAALRAAMTHGDEDEAASLARAITRSVRQVSPPPVSLAVQQ